MKREHGTIKNYIIGYILSLLFTLIPYYLVVNQIVTGLVLLGTILAFALVQAIIQVVFFLHLGRERSPRWQTKFLLGTVGGIFVVTVGTTWILYHLHSNMMPTAEALQLAQDEGIAQVGDKKTGACDETYVIHQVIIKNNIVSPSHTNARLCDMIEFINDDSAQRYIAFGPHLQHVAYGGVAGISLPKGQPQTLILNELGSQTFHDHLHDQTTGDFAVSP